MEIGLDFIFTSGELYSPSIGWQAVNICDQGLAQMLTCFPKNVLNLLRCPDDHFIEILLYNF